MFYKFAVGKSLYYIMLLLISCAPGYVRSRNRASEYIDHESKFSQSNLLFFCQMASHGLVEGQATRHFGREFFLGYHEFLMRDSFVAGLT